MKLLTWLDGRTVWGELLGIAALMAPVMLWARFTDGQSFPLVLAYWLGVCALAGYWLGSRWWLVPLLAMGVELAFAVPATLGDPSGGETPLSVVLEAPFWTGLLNLVAAWVGGGLRAVVDERAWASGRGAG